MPLETSGFLQQQSAKSWGSANDWLHIFFKQMLDSFPWVSILKGKKNKGKSRLCIASLQF